MNIKNHENQQLHVASNSTFKDFTEKLRPLELAALQLSLRKLTGVPKTVLETAPETKNVHSCDVIITNPAGEQYIVHQEEFLELRRQPTKRVYTAVPI